MSYIRNRNIKQWNRILPVHRTSLTLTDSQYTEPALQELACGTFEMTGSTDADIETNVPKERLRSVHGNNTIRRPIRKSHAPSMAIGQRDVHSTFQLRRISSTIEAQRPGEESTVNFHNYMTIAQTGQADTNFGGVLEQ